MHLTARLTIAAGGIALAIGTGAPVADAAAPVTPPVCGQQSASYSTTDIDADAVSDDVVGVPRASAGGLAGAGVVDVHNSPGDGARMQRFGESLFAGLIRPAAGDAFGSSIAFTHLSGSSGRADECADLAIGAPGANHGLGHVIIALGSNDGVSPTGAILLQGKTPNERFGSSVVADGNDVYVGAPYRDAHGVTDSGAVDHYRIDATSGTATLVETLNENTYGIHGAPERYDHFGQHLDISYRGPLIVGEPGEDVGTHAVDAGTVTVVFDAMSADGDHGRLHTSYTYSQNSPGIPGGSEAGDHFGASISSQRYGFYGESDPTQTRDLYNLSVGVPEEAIGRLRGAGAVDIFTVRSDRSDAGFVAALSQGTPYVPGDNQANDQFGKSVALINNEVYIGIPGKAVLGAAGSGRVVFNSLNGVLDSPDWGVYQQGSAGDPHVKPQAGATFGAQLSRTAISIEGDSAPGGGEQAVIAAPGANSPSLASGEVHIEPEPGAPSDFAITITDSSGPAAGERYGVLATAVSNGEVQ